MSLSKFLLSATFIAASIIPIQGNAQDVSRRLQKPERPSPSVLDQTWNGMNETIKMSFGNSNTRYAPNTIPAVQVKMADTLRAWKGEKVHSQLVLWTKTGAAVEVVATPLSAKNAAAIPVEAGFVDYVWTDEFGNGCGARKTTDFDSFPVADIIKTGELKGQLEARTVQPVWVSVDVPHNAKTGLYKSTISLKTNGKRQTATLYVDVSNRTLPEPSKWSFNLDLWQHPAAIARVHNVPLWSEKHFELMKPYYTMLAKAGQKNITASIVNEPWNHQTFDDFPSLIKWTKKRDGNWTFDYSLFDKYIQFVMDCGINQRINCYSMIPWKIAFEYFDEKTGKTEVFTKGAGTPEYHEFWKTMLTDFTAHLKQKGWFEKTTIAMDERPMKAMQAVINVLGEVDKEWKIALAGDYHPEIEKNIFDYCVASRWKFPAEVLNERQKNGQLSTWYTCCTEVYPNGFTFSPPAEHVWIGWYTAAHNMDGYLRWAYNSWTEHPNKDSRFKTWPAGDTYQVYVGPYTSIRFEKLIEGIQDFEKIRILKEEFTKADDSANLQELNAVLKGFEIGRLQDVTAEEMVQEAKQRLF